MTKRWLLPAAAGVCVVVCLLTLPGRETEGAAPRKIPERAAVGAYILGPKVLISGSTVAYRVAVHWASGPEVSGPLPGARVALSLTRGKQTHPVGSGRTDATGNLQVSFGLPKLESGAYDLLVQIDSSLGRSVQRTGVQVFPGGRVLVTTDKSLYQPSQTIHIRALALRSIDLRPVASSPVVLRVVDPKGNVVFRQQGRTSRFGVASLDFALADEINLGRYSVEAWVKGAGKEGRATRQVEVTRYVLPKFRVSIEPERPFYRPGETVRGTVRAEYFFGKPVTKAWVGLDARSVLGGAGMIHSLPPRRTDDQGRATFEIQLPGRIGSPGDDGEVRVLARVTDGANHREVRDVSLPLTSRSMHLGVIAENGRLVAGVTNRVHVVATYPDGKPTANAHVEITARETKLVGRTDELGVATFSLLPRAGGACADRHGVGRAMPLAVEAKDALGQRGAMGLCAAFAAPRALLVRPARSLFAPGEPVRVELLGGAEGELLFLDVVKGGQTLATYARAARQARASFVFAPDAALFGLLELRGYRLSKHGERIGTSRMVYVDHPGQLQIKATADRAVYRPGARARISFQVTDSRSGEGVEAALGLLAVDEALVALGGLSITSPKIFFTLSSEARGGVVVGLRPAGKDLAAWVGSDERFARRARASDVLLAAVEPAPAAVWETNPWKERREAWAQQGPQLVAAARSYMRTHSVGLRTAAGWRFHPELVARMARDGVIGKEQVNDPWQRAVRPWQLREIDRGFVFAPLADRLAREKLESIYNVLDREWQRLKLPRERMRKLPPRKWPLLLPRDLLQRLVRAGKLEPSDVIDPWGQPYRVLRHPRRYVNPYYTGLVSRTIIHSAGPDGVSGTKDDIGPSGPEVMADGADAEDALESLIGDQIGESYGVGGLGLMGTGRGGGGFGEGTIGLGRLGTIGHGGGMAMPGRVRSLFPETLLWRPELITDRHGRAALDVELADSITDWRLLATGSTADGLLGQSSLTLRVFQDFFVDLDLPLALTQNDRISVPVSVYNYLKTPQRVTLRLKPESWFNSVGPLEQTIDLRPSQVGVRYFPIVARRVGRGELTVHASAGTLTDAVRRATLVEPDGVQRALTASGTLRGAAPGAAAARSATATTEIVIPDTALAGTERLQLAMYSGPMGQTLDGLEGMLRMPYGCFEQTSSTTYPNVLILDYLRRTGKVTAAVEKRAREMINLGYQRLIGFEVKGGGFSWFGNAPAHKVLTAYGLMEFADMARVHPVDPNLVARTQRWLVGLQRVDGSWAPDGYNIADGATNHYTADALRVTAYVAQGLKHSGYRGPALTRALGYVTRNLGRAQDPYTLALLGNLLVEGPTARSVLERLWKQRRTSDQGIRFATQATTLTYGSGQSGDLETTALAALALVQSPSSPDSGDRVIDALVASKDRFGAWYSTQATILSLRALLSHHERSKARTAGELQIVVDGQPRETVRLRAGERDVARQLDLSGVARRGRHRIELRFTGTGAVQYRVAGSYWVPRAHEPQPSSSGLRIATTYDRTQVGKGHDVQLSVEVRNAARRQAQMPLVRVPLPPGFAVQEQDLIRLVGGGKVDKVQRIGGDAVLYLSKLAGGESLRFTVHLSGKYPVHVQARPAVVYEYYRPENRGESRPQALQVL